jgi:CRISPR-associated protein Cas2
MVVLILEKVPPSLRGELTRWLLELKTGVFVGRVSGMVRDRLWERVCAGTGTGGAILLHNSDSEQGFAIRMHGTPSRAVVDFEGLSLIRIP